MQLFYTVMNDDTLYQIATRWDLPVEVVIAANNLIPPYTIYSGKQLSIPPGVNIIRVVQDDTLDQISHHYRVPKSVIIEANQLKPPYQLKIDQLLHVPPGVPYYVVQKGDTLYQIAKSFNVLIAGLINPEPIKIVNQLKLNQLYPGMKIRIPYMAPLVSGLIAYTSNKNGNFDLSIFNPSNGSVQVTNGLAEAYSVPVWSWDNKKIAFVGKLGNLYILSLESDDIECVDQINEGFDGHLEWSPNNQKLVYVKSGQVNFYDTITKSHGLIGNKRGASDANWFPNGEELLFQSPDLKGISQIYRIHANGTELQQITKNSDGRLRNIRLSNDGSSALYTTTIANNIHLQIIDLSTGSKETIKEGALMKNTIPLWSPQSNKIAYIATGNMTSSSFSFIRSTDTTGENHKTYAISDYLATSLAWSPDERIIGYLSGWNDNSTAGEIWLVDVKHPAPIRILEAQQITSLTWSNSEHTNPKS